MMSNKFATFVAELLIDFLNELSWDIDIAKEYNPMLNKYEDNNTNE